MAIASATDIANRALSKLGDVRITDIDTDNTKAARAMAHRLPFLRDLLLQSYPWRFALEITTLPADSTAPAWGYARRFLFPSDCLRLWSVGDYAIDIQSYGVQFRIGGTSSYPSDAPFEVYGDYIHTDLTAPLKIQYVKQITDTGKFPDVFTEALAAKMAADAAEELTQSASKMDRAERDFQRAMRMARMIDSFQRPPASRSPGKWMMSRLG